MTDITRQYIKKLINGSYKDFTALYNLYAPQLYAYVFSLTKSRSLTQDIVQETFIKVWVKREQIDENLSFKSYLFTIARNHLLNEFRRKLNSPVFSDYMHLDAEEPYSESTIEMEIDFDEFNRSLRQAKERLPRRQAQIFELNKEQDISVKEIAQMLNISEQVVRNQLSAALQIIRSEMGKYAFLFVIFFMNANCF
jgi:RNA polymerase sigma-70 factor (ECF subfamily)